MVRQLKMYWRISFNLQNDILFIYNPREPENDQSPKQGETSDALRTTTTSFSISANCSLLEQKDSCIRAEQNIFHTIKQGKEKILVELLQNFERNIMRRNKISGSEDSNVVWLPMCDKFCVRSWAFTVIKGPILVTPNTPNTNNHGIH